MQKKSIKNSKKQIILRKFTSILTLKKKEKLKKREHLRKRQRLQKKSQELKLLFNRQLLKTKLIKLKKLFLKVNKTFLPQKLL